MFKLSKNLSSASLVAGLLASSEVTSFATPNNNEKEYRNLINTMHVNGSYQNVGIPAALFINVDPDKKHDPRSAIELYYHKPEDNLSNLSVERLERTVKLVGSSVYDLVDLD